jgi:hypothetical protein
VLVLGRDQTSATLLHSIFREKTSSALSDVCNHLFLFVGWTPLFSVFTKASCLVAIARRIRLREYLSFLSLELLFLKNVFFFLCGRSNFHWPQ